MCQTVNPAPVTPRELEVLSLLAIGGTRNSIARELYITPEAVKARSTSLREKLGAATSAEAVYKAMKLSLLN